jgi:hypothetical protein
MPILPWMKGKAKEDGTETLEVNLPKETQDKLDKAIGVADELPKIRELLSGLGGITEYVTAAKQREEAAAAEARNKQNRQSKEETDEELQQLILSDPAAAINKAITPQSQAILLLHAANMRRDVFENTEKFPYYSGEIKSEVDKLLAGQDPKAQIDMSVIENCYYTVLGKHGPEIAEGKLKSRFASASGNSGTSGGNMDKGGEGKVKLDINDDIKRAARITGVTPEAYAEMLVEDGIGYV